MKSLLLLLLIGLYPAYLQQDAAKCVGTYKVVYDKGQQGHEITFSDSTFVQKMPDAITYKGKIKYEKFKVLLRKSTDENPIEIDKREINKDTIKFATKSNRDLSLTVNRGKMYKLK